MKCLNCHTEMTNYLVHAFFTQISYDVCEACGSFWLDAEELDKISVDVEGSIEYSTRQNAEDTSEDAKPCPRCEAVTDIGRWSEHIVAVDPDRETDNIGSRVEKKLCQTVSKAGIWVKAASITMAGNNSSQPCIAARLFNIGIPVAVEWGADAGSAPLIDRVGLAIVFQDPVRLLQ